MAIGDETGRHHDDALALGWLGFRTGDIPDTNIHISRANARVLLQRYFAAHVTVEQVPMARVEQLLGRALGRALAHELGHYLMASPAHARSGLMRGNQQADDFFWPDSRAFDVGDEDLQLVASAWPRVALSTRPAVATAGG